MNLRKGSHTHKKESLQKNPKKITLSFKLPFMQQINTSTIFCIQSHPHKKTYKSNFQQQWAATLSMGRGDLWLIKMQTLHKRFIHNTASVHLWNSNTFPAHLNVLFMQIYLRPHSQVIVCPYGGFKHQLGHIQSYNFMFDSGQNYSFCQC